MALGVLCSVSTRSRLRTNGFRREVELPRCWFLRCRRSSRLFSSDRRKYRGRFLWGPVHRPFAGMGVWVHFPLRHPCFSFIDARQSARLGSPWKSQPGDRLTNRSGQNGPSDRLGALTKRGALMTDIVGTGVTGSASTPGPSGERLPYVKPFLVDLDAKGTGSKEYAASESIFHGFTPSGPS
jgi:hypothetical protein